MLHVKPSILRFYISLGLIFSVLMTQCLPKVLAALNRVSNGKIIEIRGNTQIQRQDSRVLLPQLGTLLYPGDQLKTTPDSQLTILCSDLSIQLIQGGKSQVNQCLVADNTNNNQECYPNTNCSHRGEDIDPWNRENIPYIISPQNTQLINSQPMLRWQGVPGAEKYTVILKENDQAIWKTEVMDTQVQYSGEPPLKLGNNYQIVVETDTGISSRDVEVPGGIDFSLLEAEKVQEVQSEVAKIQSQGLEPESEKLAIATLYENYGLLTEAVELLETVAHTEKAAPIYKKIGDLYWLTWELAPVAKPYYLQAIESAHPQDLETLTFAKDGLGQIEVSLGSRGKALELFREVKAGYEQLGEIQQMQEVEKQIQDLEN